MMISRKRLPIYLSSVALVLCVIAAFWIPYYLEKTMEQHYSTKEVSETFEKYYENLNDSMSETELQHL
jgi:hypothetical protein